MIRLLFLMTLSILGLMGCIPSNEAIKYNYSQFHNTAATLAGEEADYCGYTRLNEDVTPVNECFVSNYLAGNDVYAEIQIQGIDSLVREAWISTHSTSYRVIHAEEPSSLTDDTLKTEECLYFKVVENYDLSHRRIYRCNEILFDSP